MSVKTDKYKDLEDVLYKGFIPLPVKVGELNFVFKSVTDVEYDKVVLMSGLKEPKHLYTHRFHLNFLYHSIYLINGHNFLLSREENYDDFISLIKSFPSKFIYSIFEKLEKLAERQNECTNLTDAYFYENISRYSWMTKKGYLLNDPISTSIAGTENIGLNQFQKYWTVYNLREDQREAFEEKYSLAKFLASFTDSKSVKKVDAADKKRKEEEESKRKRIIEYGNDPEEYAKHHLSGPIDTAEQLVDSLNRQIRGEKDEHDRAIEQYESKLREDMYTQMKSLKTMRDTRAKEASYFVDETRPISAEEMAKRIKNLENKPKIYLSDFESDDRTKYLEMSNVSDKDVIEKNNLMSKDEFNELVSDELFSGKHNRIDSVEEDYLYQQKKLAESSDFEEEEANFPNLRKR